MGAECSKLRQPMRAIFALSRAQLIFLVVTRSRDLSRECHVTKHKTPARSNFPLSNFENSGTIQFSSSSSTSRGLCPKNFEKRAHPNQWPTMSPMAHNVPMANMAPMAHNSSMAAILLCPKISQWPTMPILPAIPLVHNAPWLTIPLRATTRP